MPRMVAFWRLALAQTPMVARASVRSVGREPVTRDGRDRQLNGDRVDVESLETVHAVGGGGRDQVQVLEGAQIAQVEDAPQVDPERVGPLAGEDDLAARQRMDGRAGQVFVLRGGARSDAAGRTGEIVRQHGGLATLDLRHRVVLAQVPVGVVQRRDRPGVVEEAARVGERLREAELVGDVRVGRAAIRDVDLVEHVVAEVVEVRSTRWALERNVVRDQCDGIGFVRADKRVDVGVVGGRVAGDLRRLTV